MTENTFMLLLSLGNVKVRRPLSGQLQGYFNVKTHSVEDERPCSSKICQFFISTTIFVNYSNPPYSISTEKQI